MDLKLFTKIGKYFQVLYVEDEEQIRIQTQKLLSNFFPNLTVCNNGQEGLDTFKAAKDKPFDIVISDINMPIMNGIDMLRHIREINDDCAFILTTAHIETDYLLDSIKMGVVYYASKPLNLKELVQHLQKVCTDKYKMIVSSHNEKENKQYLDILDNITIVTKTDLKGTITYANDRFCEISGYSKEELIGSNHRLVRHPEVSKTVFDSLWNTIRDGKTWQGKVKNKAKDGSAYIVSATVFPMYDELDENILGYMSVRFLITDEEEEKRDFKKKVIQNIQVQKKKEQELNNKIKELEQQAKQSGGGDTTLVYEQLEQERKKSSMAKAQVQHYEKDLKNAEQKYSTLVQTSNKRIADMVVENKKIKESSDKFKDLAITVKAEVSGLKEEIIRLEEMVKNQAKLNHDLKDVIKHTEEELAKYKK